MTHCNVLASVDSRSGTNSSIRSCYFVKLKHLHCQHHRLIIHLPHPCHKCKSNGGEHQATIDDGGVRIEGTRMLWWLTTSTMKEAGQNHLTALVQDLPAVCASVYHQNFKPAGGDLWPQSWHHHTGSDGWQRHHSNLRGDCSPNNRKHYCHDGRHQSNSGQHHSNDMLHHSNQRQNCSPPHWRLSLFQWWAAEFLQRVADFQWWVRELVQVARQEVQSMLSSGIG